MKLKYVVQFTGVIITIIGWLLSNHEHYQFIYPLIVPKYVNAITAHDKIYEKDFILNQNDIGFSEISEILKQHISGDGIPILTQIKTLASGKALMRRGKNPSTYEDYLELEISFSNAGPTQGKFYELKSQIEKAYLTSTIFAWSNAFFWIGIIITIISVFL